MGSLYVLGNAVQWHAMAQFFTPQANQNSRNDICSARIWKMVETIIKHENMLM
jgi:hypothetical protein